MKTATHEDFIPRHEARGSSDRAFGLVSAALFLLIALGPLRWGRPLRAWALVPGACLLLIAIFRPGWLRILNRLWKQFGLFTGRVVSPIVTTALFFLVIAPTGVLFRLFGRNPLRLGFDVNAGSYWIERHPPGPQPKTMTNQF